MNARIPSIRLNAALQGRKFPDDWEIVELREVGVFSKGAGITKSDLVENGLPCIRYGEIYSSHAYVIKRFYSFVGKKVAALSRRIRAGDLLFAGSGETADEIGKCVAFLGEEEAYAGGDIIILRPKKGDSTFLSYMLNHDIAIRQKSRLGQGHSVVHIYPDLLKRIIIPLPPLQEQRKIAAILSTWDRVIELVGKQIEAKQRLKKGLMQRLLTGKLRFAGFGAPARDGELPKEWRIEELNQLSEIRVSNVDKKSAPDEEPVFLCNYLDAYNNTFAKFGAKAVKM